MNNLLLIILFTPMLALSQSQRTYFKGNNQFVATAPVVYATLNPSDKSANITLSGGFLTWATSGGTAQLVRSTIAMAVNNKYYIEIPSQTNTTSADNIIGWCTNATPTSSYPGSDLNGYGLRTDVGDIRRNGSNNTYTSALSDGHVWGLLFDLTSGASTFTLKIDNVSQGSFSIADGPYYFAIGGVNAFNFTGTVNFGPTFTYPQSGYIGLHN